MLRKKMITLRLSDREKKELEEKAKKEQLTIAEYIRKKCKI